MKVAMTAEAIGRFKARPPSLTGLLRRSPTVAPSGRERIKAAQNKKIRETFIQKYPTASTINRAANTSAAPSYPKPVSSAIQSPSRGRR